MANIKTRRSSVSTAPTAPGMRRRADLDRVMRSLEEICTTLGPGSRIATHTELMRNLGASERTVLRALDEMQRSGLVVRRHGSGTYVASQTPSTQIQKTEHMNAIVAIARPDHAFFDRCIRLLYGHSRAANLDLVCRLIGEEVSVSSVLSSINNAAGYIVFGYANAPLAVQLQMAGHRVVVVGAPPADVTPDVPCVHSKHQQGGYLAANHLFQLGHKRLDFATDDPNPKKQLRWQGIQRAVSEAQRQGKSVSVETLDSHIFARWDVHPEGARAYFNGPGAPTGLIVWNDHEAIKIIATLNRAGLRVPEDLSVIGYDDSPEGALMHPPLSTIDSMIHDQLDAAVELLAQPIPARAPYTLVVVPSLVARGTTAPISS